MISARILLDFLAMHHQWVFTMLLANRLSSAHFSHILSRKTNEMNTLRARSVASPRQSCPKSQSLSTSDTTYITIVLVFICMHLYKYIRICTQVLRYTYIDTIYTCTHWHTQSNASTFTYIQYIYSHNIYLYICITIVELRASLSLPPPLRINFLYYLIN